MKGTDVGQAVGDILPLAIGVAISPVPIIAVILMLFSDRARSNSLAFLAGWIGGIVAGLVIVIAIAGTANLSTGGEPSTRSSWIKVVLGILLLLMAAREWRGRPAPGVEVPMPGWMKRIDQLGTGAAIGLGLLLSVVNPKNLLLILGAGVTIAQAAMSTGGEVVTVLVFTVLGACTVALPTLAYLILGQRAQPSLDAAKAWLSVHNAAVMAVLLLVFGVTLVGKGLGGLL